MLRVHPFGVLSDNYCYLVIDDQTRTAAVVDPPDAEAAEQALEAEGVKPAHIWITHHHADHTAGVSPLRRRYGPLPVYGAAHDSARIPELTQGVREGDQFEFGGETVRILEVPGHANGHIAFYLPDSGHVFSGDVVFGASCGKVFEGTFEEMYGSVQKIAALPESTRIWCGHEYTQGGLTFACAIDPDNQTLKERLENHQVPSIPLMVGVEKATNPFMRCEDPVMRQFTGETEPARVFGVIRQRKDRGL